jgi:formylglycine-generating enzyme required for sulfatase activity
MTEFRKLRVFLCHASQDKPIVRELYQRLLAEGWIDPWLDKEKLLPGQEWKLEIEKSLETTDVVLVCLSNNSITKEGYVQKEMKKVLDIADEKPEGTIFVIPLRLDDCQSPKRFEKWQYEDYFPAEQRDYAYKRLFESLKTRVITLNSKSDTPDLQLPSEVPVAIQRVNSKVILPIIGILLVLFIGLAFVFNGKSKSTSSNVTVSPMLTLSRTSTPPKLTATLTPTPKVTPSYTPVPQLGSTRLSAKDGMLMVYVPAGDFIMGSNNNYPDEKPEHKVYLAPFWIDRTEVTNAMYSLCVAAIVCKPPSRTDYYSRDASSPEYPVVFVSWSDAKTYCEWTGARLPTEAEWEKVARGEKGLIYPWGNQFECQRGNFDDETDEDANVVTGGPNCDRYKYIAPVGSFPNGKSVYGALDMAGNVWEWVSDWYGDSYYYKYIKTPIANPTGPDLGNRRVVKGGAWLNDRDVLFRGSNRYNYAPELVDDNVGFRCVMPEK